MTSDVASARASGTDSASDAATPRPMSPLVRRALLVVIVLAALGIRVFGFRYQSMDYLSSLKRWYDFIAAHGGFSALRYQFANYNVPYLYLLAGLTYLPVSALTGIKMISVAFDLVLAFFVYRLVGLRYRASWPPMAAMAIVLFLPTVVTNSAWWAQSDSLYAAFAVGAVYFVLRERFWVACAFLGFALAMKLQAVFVFPLLLLFVVTRRMPLRCLLAIPAVYLALDLPAILLGASPRAVLTVYAMQSGQYQQLTLNAPSVYQFVPQNADANLFHTAGVVFTGVAVLTLIAAVVFSRIELTPPRIVLSATVCAILVPFFLPSMHERYFYVADVLSVVAAFWLPRRLWYLPVLVQTASFLSYVPVLFGPMTRGGVPGRFAGGGRPGAGGGFPGGGRAGAGTGRSPFAGGSPFGGGADRPFGHGTQPPTGRFFGGFQPGGAVPGTPEFRFLAATMGLALVTALWFTIREFRAGRKVPPGMLNHGA